MSANHLDRIEGLVQQLSQLARPKPDSWRDVDLTIGQLKAVFVLNRRQPESLTGLASTPGISMASASALVERLVRLGMVSRRDSPNDRRQVMLELEPAGEALIARIEERSRARLREGLIAPSPRGLEALEIALTELLEVAGKLQSPARRQVHGETDHPGEPGGVPPTAS